MEAEATIIPETAVPESSSGDKAILLAPTMARCTPVVLQQNNMP